MYNREFMHYHNLIDWFPPFHNIVRSLLLFLKLFTIVNNDNNSNKNDNITDIIII